MNDIVEQKQTYKQNIIITCRLRVCLQQNFFIHLLKTLNSLFESIRSTILIVSENAVYYNKS